MESDGGSVDTTEKWGNGKIILVSGSWLNLELFRTNSILKVSPDCVGLELVGVVLDLKSVMSCLSGFAVEDDVVLGKWLFTDTLKFVLIFFLGRLIFECKKTRCLAHPLWLETELEVILGLLSNEHLGSVKEEATTFGLLEMSNDFPFKA